MQLAEYILDMGIYDYLTDTTTLYLGGICLALFLTYDFWKKLYFWRHGIPGPFPLPIIGSIFAFNKGFTSDFLTKKNKYGKVYGFSFMGRSFAIHDLDMLQEILIRRFSSFPNHGNTPFEDKPFHKAVTIQRDGHWKATRNTLSPAFTGSKMKQVNPLINECCDQLVQHFDELSKSGAVIQCKDLYGAYSMDVAATSFFGMQLDSQKNPNNLFVKYAKEGFEMGFFNLKILIGLIVPGMAKLYNLLGVQITKSHITRFFTGVITKALDLRKKEGSKRTDILQLMIDAHKLDSSVENEEDELVRGRLERENTSSRPSSKTALSSEEIMANAVFFLLAGYETTSTALCMTSYLLATNKEHQEKLIQEVDEFASRREDVTYETLSKMEYLDCVVKESLRLYPPAAASDRLNDKGDIVIKGLLIPDGFSIVIPIYAIHHDPDIWDEPEEFRPERFSKENRANIRPVSWLPFGDGPRSCIGMRLALMGMKSALVRMLQEFKFDTCTETEIPPVLNTKTSALSPPNGVKLQVVPRKKID